MDDQGIAVSKNSSSTNSQRATSAQFYAEKGWPVLPLHFPTGSNRCSCGKDCSSIGKHPMTPHGFKDASFEDSTVRKWWAGSPNANLGIVTGQVSGVVVLDIDPRHGGTESLEQLETEYGPIPPTLRVKTGGDGQHLYFKHPGEKITNRTNIRPGVDFRGDGGYIVAPPSVHASSQEYSWDTSHHHEMAPLPEWLLNLLRSPIPKPKVATQTSKSYLGEGNRHTALLSIGGFLKHKGADQRLIMKALSTLNEGACNPPLDAKEVAQIASGLDKYSEEPWDDPEELSEPVAAPKMPQEMLPEALRAWCSDIAERMQVPLEFTAGTAVVMLAAAIGRKVIIRPKQHDDWRVVPNLWGILIAPPGSLKSPAMGSVLNPLNDLAIKAREDYLNEMADKETREAIAKTEIDALRDGFKSAVKQGNGEIIDQRRQDLEVALKKLDELKQIHERRYFTNDPTIEKLLSLLEGNPQGLLLFRDEISGWLETMHKSGREGDREFFLESWNGDSPYSMDRVGRGSTFVDGLCLSVMGGLQPGKFASYVSSVAKGGKSDDGLLQRFQILLYPERRKKWRKIDRKPDETAKKTVALLLEKIDSIPLPLRENGRVSRIELRYDKAAQLAADEWQMKLEDRLCNGDMSPILEAHLSKYRSLMPSLALIFELTETLTTGNSILNEVKAPAVNLAIQWCAFLEAHACRAYGEFIEEAEAAARRLLAKIKDGSVKDYDRCRDIFRRGWSGLKNADSFEAAIKTLTDKNWIRIEAITPTSGGRSEVIRLNPCLRLTK